MTDPNSSARPGRTLAPPEIRSLAHARREARLARDWAEADRLKVAIESAGWRVVDRGVDFALRPALAPDVVVDGVTWYGSSSSVPSVLDVPPDLRMTILVTGGVIAAVPAATDREVIAVLAQADADGTTKDPGGAVRLAGDPSPGAKLAGGLRRARGAVVVVVDGQPIPGREALDELAGVLDDPSVACCGAAGATTADLRTFLPVEAGDADVLLPGVVAFRRADAVAALPVDERFVSLSRTVEWWSLRLREGDRDVDGHDGDGRDGAAPRRAVVVPGLGAATAASLALVATEDRASKRDFYRLNDTFGGRDRLLSGLG